MAPDELVVNEGPLSLSVRANEREHVLATWERLKELMRHPGWALLQRERESRQEKERRGLRSKDSAAEALEAQCKIDGLGMPERFMALYQELAERAEHARHQPPAEPYDPGGAERGEAAIRNARVIASLVSLPGWRDFERFMEMLIWANKLLPNGHDFDLMQRCYAAAKGCEAPLRVCKDTLNLGANAEIWVEREKGQEQKE